MIGCGIWIFIRRGIRLLACAVYSVICCIYQRGSAVYINHCRFKPLITMRYIYICAVGYVKIAVGMDTVITCGYIYISTGNINCVVGVDRIIICIKRECSTRYIYKFACFDTFAAYSDRIRGSTRWRTAIGFYIKCAAGDIYNILTLNSIILCIYRYTTVRNQDVSGSALNSVLTACNIKTAAGYCYCPFYIVFCCFSV